MSRSQRAGDHIATAPPSSSRYRTSLRPKGVGSSSTKVVVGDGHQERGYDSEMVRDGGAAMPYSGYHTEQPSSKRASKDLYRAALDPRRNGARLSSMPSSHPQQSQYTYIQDPRQSAVDEHGALGDESAAEQSSSLRRVKKDKERRHRDRDREYDQGAVPASVWMAQVADPKTSRSHRRESRSRPRHEETPQQTQHDLPRTIPQDHKYTYAQHPSHYRAVNATPDYYRSNGTEHYVPATPLLSSTPRYPYVIDDRAGMASPPPVEVPHAFPSETTPYIDHHVPSTPLPLPRNVDQLRADGLIPGSPAHSHRRHRPARSEDVTAAGLFADGSEHPRPLRHRPSRSEDLRKLGLGQAPPPEEHPSHLARPVHIGRSASETTVPTQAQLATPGMYTSGLAVTPAVPAPAPARGLVMHPQLQESFAESANASRAPVNAAMASAAVANGTTDSDSSRERKRRTRRSRQPDASPAPELVESQIPKDPTPPPVVVHPSGKRQRTASGRSAVTPVPGESDEKKDDDMIVYRTPDPVVVESSRAPPIVQHIGALRAAQEGQGVGLAMFGSMTPAGIAHVGTRVEAPHVSRPEMTSAGAGAPRADAGHEPLRQVETGRTAVEVVPRRGSVLDSVIGQEERTRKPSGSGTEERSRVLLDVGGGKRTHVGVADVQRRPSPGTEVPRRPSPATEVQRRPSPATEVQRRPSPGTEDHRRPSLDKDRHAHGRKSIDSDGSLESFQSAELAASTAATHDAFYPAQDFHSARDAMSPMSNYQSIAPSVRSGANESRVLTEVRNIVDSGAAPTNVIMQGSKAATVGHRPHANTIPPAALPKERTIPHKTSATPLVAPKPAEPEHRPRIPSGNMLPPPEVPVHRATVDVHMREQPSALVVDEDGRLTRAPVSAPITSTMPVRTTRTSLTMQRQPPPPAAPVASPPQTHPPPPQTHAAPPPTHVSPPQTHAQAQPDAQASALPKNMQQPQPNGSSKESLVDSANVKPGKSKSSRWFWKSKPSEPAPPKAPSPTPPQAPPTTQPRVRQTSILGGLMGQSSSSKSKSARKSPDPHAHHASEMYGSLDSTPSSLTLNLEPEPKKDESRMPRMFASVKNALRRTPSTAKISHGLSRSMSRLPGTTPAPAAPPPGAPLTRSASTNGREIPRPMSPPRVKEALKSGKDGVPPPPPIDVAATKDASVPIPAAPVSAPIITSAPAPPPVSAPPIVAPVAVPATPKPRGPETAPIKDDRRPPPKEVPIVEKVRAPTSSGARASLDQSQATVTKERRLIDANGRVIESTSRSDKRSSTQAAPPHPRAASPPLVTRPVTATRIPANQTGIFSSGPPRAPSTQPVPPPVSSSSRAQGSRSGRGSSRDYGHAPPPSSRPPRAREPLPAPVAVPVIDPSLPAPAGELGLPTPDETPRASPTREEVFEPRAHREKERERSRERRRPADIVVPPPDLGAVTAKLNAEVERQGANGGVLKFVHRQKRAVSIASLEAVTGQEAHFRSEASSIRTVTPGPGSTAFPTRDPHEATEDWRMLQLQEDMRLNTGKGKATSRRDSVASRGVLKRDRGGGVRKAGVAFDFPGPVIDEDVEDQFDAMKKVDIEMTYELERRKKRYK